MSWTPQIGSSAPLDRLSSSLTSISKWISCCQVRTFTVLVIVFTISSFNLELTLCGPLVRPHNSMMAKAEVVSQVFIHLWWLKPCKIVDMSVFSSVTQMLWPQSSTIMMMVPALSALSLLVDKSRSMWSVWEQLTRSSKCINRCLDFPNCLLIGHLDGKRQPLSPLLIRPMIRTVSSLLLTTTWTTSSLLKQSTFNKTHGTRLKTSSSTLQRSTMWRVSRTPSQPKMSSW